MADHTPTTEAVRNAYIAAMRNAHVASTGEAGAEFDRWVSARLGLEFDAALYSNATLIRIISRAKTVMQARADDGVIS